MTDVARLAGVSASAVSRTLTPGASVSPTTRKQVLAAIATLSYRPNLVARSLSTSRSSIIGVAVTHLNNEFYPTFLEELSSRLAERSYRILLFITRGALDLDPLIDELRAHRIDGLVLASSSQSSKLARECDQRGIPVVMFNNTDVDSNVASISGDNENGARTIARFLIAGGHSRFAFVAGVADSSASREREVGFARELLESGAPKPLIVQGNYTHEGAALATRQLLSLKHRPDAIFCANDQMALSTLQVVRHEYGLTPGQDISVVGFDDVAIASWAAFSLTTFSQPLLTMAKRVAELIITAIDGESISAVRERTPGELVVRSSSRRPAVGVFRRENGVETWQEDA